MRKLSCSLGIALLVTWGSGTLADEPLATGYVQPPTQPAPLQPAPLPSAAGETPPRPDGNASARAGEPAALPVEKAVPPTSVVPPADPLLLKLKAQIKTVRLSLAEATGRLAVTEKDLATANADVNQLRTANTTLHANLAKAETIGKKAEEEVAVRRKEVSSLTERLAKKPSSGGSSTALVFALVLAMILSVVVFSLGGKVRRSLDRLPDGKAEEKRLEQLRVQLKDEQQKALRLDEECSRLRDANNRPANGGGGAGSKKDKIEQARREAREARAEADAQKRAAAEKVAALQAEAQATADVQKRATDEKITALETEVEQLVAANRRLEELLAKANEKLTFLGHDEEASPEIIVTQPTD
jgi:DNA repair exonuclease SbcCD ATPase subunit